MTYSIRPHDSLPHGTVIPNEASIIFDANEAILTPPTSHTLDVRDPVVSSLGINQGQMQRSRAIELIVAFDEDTLVYLDSTAFALRELSTGADISIGSDRIVHSEDSLHVTLNLEGLPLLDDNYSLIIDPTRVHDQGGRTLAGVSTWDFFTLTGDANGDRLTNERDLYQIWQNSLKSEENRPANDDLNGDAHVDNGDLQIVKEAFLRSLPSPVAPQASHPPDESASAPSLNQISQLQGAIRRVILEDRTSLGPSKASFTHTESGWSWWWGKDER